MDLGQVNYLAGSVQASVQAIVRHFAVDYFTLHLFRSGDDAKNTPYVRTNYPDAWVSHYLLNDYVRIDPVLQKAQTTDVAFCWSTLILGAEHAQMMQQAAAHGVGPAGFSIRHVDTLGRRSVLSFNAAPAAGQTSWQPFVAQHNDHLRLLAAELHEIALSEIGGDGDDHPQLSPREAECLRWTAQGKTHTDIAVILNLSEHTVRSYLKDARIKLDSMTLAQAVSKASSLGLI